MVIQDYVFAGFSMPERLWDESKTRIRWYSLKNYDLATATQVVVDAVLDQTIKKNIIVACFQKWGGVIERSKLTACFDKIVAAVKSQKQNKLCFATMMFVPNSSSVWNEVGKINDEIRWYNELLGMPPVSLHKMGTTTVSEVDLSLRVKGMIYVEFQLGLALGMHPSYEGVIKIRNFIINVFDYTFSPGAYKGKSRFVRVKVPPPLIQTEGYRFDPFHRQELEDRNLTGRPASTGGERRSRLTWSQRRPEGWRRWDIYKNNPCWTKEERERALRDWLEEINRSDERPVWSKESPVARDQTKAADHAETEDQNDDLIVFSEDDVFEQDGAGSMDEDREVENITQRMEALNSREDLTVEIQNDRICNESEQEEEGFYDSSDDERTGYKRYNKVNEELVKQYRKQITSKNVQIVKEKAASKEWRSTADKMEKDVDYYKRKVQLLEEQLNRVIKEYNYLKDLYEDGGRKRGVKVFSKRFAKKHDFVVKDK